jgi:hypothetical protein
LNSCRALASMCRRRLSLGMSRASRSNARYSCRTRALCGAAAAAAAAADAAADDIAVAAAAAAGSGACCVGRSAPRQQLGRYGMRPCMHTHVQSGCCRGCMGRVWARLGSQEVEQGGS